MTHPTLVVVDVQERLFNVMDADKRDDMVTNIKILATAALRLGAPVLITEQYPKGLGRTLPEVRALLEGVTPLEKTAFSCVVLDRASTQRTGTLNSSSNDAFMSTASGALSYLEPPETRTGRPVRRATRAP